MKEVSDSGKLLDGSSVTSIRGDSTCVDSAAATAAAERLITSDNVNAIVGGDCSGVTGAILQNVARPNGVVMVSPSATSPALSTAEDDNLFFHEDGKGDYSAEVGALAQAGGEVLIVAGYLDQGGKGVIQASLDTGAFDTFVLPDGMIGDSLPAAIGDDLNGSFGTVPGTDSEGAEIFEKMAADAGIKSDAFSAESYDAAALIMLAMQAAGSSDSESLKGKLMDVANAPGEEILPGELGKALEILAGGGEIDYVGATAVELIGAGESAGNYREILVKDGKNTTANFR